MKMIVCIKQVILGDQVRMDPRTHTMIRSLENSRMNPYDVLALDLAMGLKKAHGGSVTAVTMGPKISEAVLWEALAAGADRAVLLSDPRFAGSDTLATSYVLGMGIRKIGVFDVILCGRRTADSDTGQVGPQLAEELDIPHVTGVDKMEWKGGLVYLERSSDGFRESLEVQAPVLLTVASRTSAMPPSLNEIQDAFIQKRIECWNLDDLKADPGKTGREGSRTWVENLIPLSQNKSCIFIEGDPRQQAKSLFDKLVRKSLIT